MSLITNYRQMTRIDGGDINDLGFGGGVIHFFYTLAGLNKPVPN